MAVCIVIPARYDSSRLPGKPLSEIGDKRLLQRVWESVCELPARSRQFRRVVVATDDDRIAALMTTAGAEVQRTSSLPRNGTERVAEVARSVSADVFVNVQGDELGLTHGMIGELLGALEDAEMATLATPRPADDPALHDPDVVKVVCDLAGNALCFSRQAVRATPDTWLHHVGLYAYRRDTLLALAAAPPSPWEQAERLEQLRALQLGVSFRVAITAEATLAVNTPADLKRAQALLRSRLQDGTAPATESKG